MGLARELAETVRTVLNVNPFVPKLGTELAAAPLAPLDVLEARLERMRRGLAGAVELRSLSPRWAWVQWRLSQGGQAVGRAAWAAARAGGGFGAWRKAIGEAASRE